MERFVVFLRAINVGGRNLVKMETLRQLLTGGGCVDVQTYIQSGNVVLGSRLNAIDLQQKIVALIHEHFGLSIDVFVLRKEHLQNALERCPFKDESLGDRIFITLLSNEATVDKIEAFKALDLGEEVFEIDREIIYYYLPQGMAQSKLNNSLVEKKLGVKATGRNLNTIVKILNMK